MTIYLNLYVLFLLFYLINICQFFKAFQSEVKEGTEVCEYFTVLELINFRGAAFDVLRKGQHNTLLQCNTVALTEEVISHKALESIDKRHILSESSNEIRQFDFIIFSEMSTKDK